MLKILILILIPFLSYSQYAEIHADINTLPFEVIEDSSNYHDVYNMEWLLKGQTLKFGSPPIKVKADTTTLDTLFYRSDSENKWESILCNIESGKTYFFDYNMCCGGFLIHSPSDTLQMPVQILIEGSEKPKNYILEYGNTSYLIKSNEILFIKEQCESAMSNDLREIVIYEIKNNVKIEYSNTSTCLIYKEKYIKPITNRRRRLLNFKYIPLNHTNEKIILNMSTGLIKIN